jgi:hypothetical protein
MRKEKSGRKGRKPDSVFDSHLSDATCTRGSTDAGHIIAAYLVLLPMGFAVPPTLLSAR